MTGDLKEFKKALSEGVAGLRFPIPPHLTSYGILSL
jgi:hypothetical protein